MNAPFDPAISTRSQITNVAERRLVKYGYNGFSYSDISSELGITNASIHYHFPSKADLGVALIDRYDQTLRHAFEQILKKEADAGAQMKAYIGMFDAAAKKGELRVCTMLGAEYAALPKIMQTRLLELCGANKAWLAEVIRRGAADGSFAIKNEAEELADTVMSALHGALIVARVAGGVAAFRNSVAILLERLIGRSEDKTS